MEIKSRVPGKVLEVKVSEGDSVKQNDVVLVLEAMKMKQPVAAPQDGVIKEIKVAAGDRVSQGTVMIIME